ncbi:sigma-54-dependent Fis family transcriptional regulator [Desulfitobacterium chlororespirans]|uniref:Transcriptional regulator containing PAS, AAA-type ATPase, and DNA-binding Fis domains n=1 Tax=Desulfitobacterium chlororespirans DSM 11544 TaxID=1121395 RepID=A0A1M7SIX2_9FIRM|nr:sigma 54-interacting transcriptional regulator [Desulfitobacterium chlororespirans]SHN58419.1 Transcriptional regulator containing PAS, AAA-type ATPase, and DNA-binding Fis domains [Desulfitobacterium chlororespirans DSM 11544]
MNFTNTQIELSNPSDFDCLFQSFNIDSELWDNILELKTEFINKNSDLRRSTIIPREIAESWLRSKNNKIDPYTKLIGKKLTKNEFENRIQRRKLLVSTASSYIKKFIPILTASNYLMSLTDENGVVLLSEGSTEIASGQHNIDIATDLSEELVGTTAHSLSIRYRKPIQIIGPYNYCNVFQDDISSATPIMDEKNNVIGALLVVQMSAKKESQDLQGHSLGWVISMGYAIENLMRVKERNISLKIMNGTLETTLSLFDEGIITIDQDGFVNHINKDGAVILGTSVDEVQNKHYTQLMKQEQVRLITDVLSGGTSVQDYETTLGTPHTEIQYLMNVKPVLDSRGESPKGAVIRLIRTEKVDKLVINRSGAKAAYHFNDIIGESTAVKNTVNIGKNIAGKAVNVLLIGESGTGKELFAQAIHNEFKSEGPFVAINCASMPRNLIESELFGYEGGAFTGAERKGRPGKIELANGGTLFLDEIGDMPLEIQPVFLRILEDKRVMRLGGSRYIPVDFRIVAATNKDLYQMVHEKTFREDLYFRLSVFKIRIPPLRDRGGDVLLLAQYFVNEISKKFNCKPPKLSAEVVRKIQEYNWPGNVRQLQNAMVYAVNMAQNGLIKLEHLPEEMMKHPPIVSSPTKSLSLKEMEKAAILEAMRVTGNNTIEASRLLGLGRTTLYRKLKEYGLEN